MTLTDLLLTKTIKISLIITISIVLFSHNASSFIFIAYAQTQSGPATSGSASGGPAIGGSAPCYNCNNYFYGGPATSGPATSGPATSGPPTTVPPTTVPPTTVPPTTVPPIAQITSLSEEYGPKNTGMTIHVSFNVQGMQGKVGNVQAYFFLSGGQALRALPFTIYKTPDGQVSVHGNFIPNWQSTSYNDYRLFIPYWALNMRCCPPYHLSYHMQIWDDSGIPHQLLVSSQSRYFTIFS